MKYAALITLLLSGFGTVNAAEFELADGSVIFGSILRCSR